MKPKLGQTVYTLYHGYIFKETVGYLGRCSFIIEGYENKYNQEYFYEDHGNTWFASFKDLKKAHPNARYDRSEGCYVLG